MAAPAQRSLPNGALVLLICLLCASWPRAQPAAVFTERFIFAGDRGHVHASSIVETPNGSLLAVWYENGPTNPAYYYRGGDADKSDDVRIAAPDGRAAPPGGTHRS